MSRPGMISPWGLIDKRIGEIESRLVALGVHTRILQRVLEIQGVEVQVMERAAREVSDALAKQMEAEPDRNPLDLILGIDE